MSQPSGPGGVAVSAVHTEAAGLPLAPLLLRIEDGDGRPLLVGYTSSQGVRRVQRRYLDRMRTGARTTETGWVRDRAGRRLDDLIRQPDAERLGDLDHVRLLPLLQSGQEGRIVAIARVRRHHPMRYCGGAGTINQVKGERRLGRERHRVGHPRRLPPLRVSSPFLGQVQPSADRPVAARVGVVRRHHRLAVRHLAQLPAVLALDPHRVLPLLRQLGVVDAQHPDLRVRVALSDHQLQPTRLQLVGFPRAVDQELLQLLRRRPRHHLGHPLPVLPRQFRDQPQQVVTAVADATRTREDPPKLLDEPLQRPALHLANDDLHRPAPYRTGLQASRQSSASPTDSPAGALGEPSPPALVTSPIAVASPTVGTSSGAPTVAASPPACQYGVTRQFADIQDRALKEASALAASQRSPGIYWTLNDSGNSPTVFGIDEEGRSRGTFRVDKAENVDWEAMQVGPGSDSGSALYIGDIGDNDRERREIVIYRVPEPDVEPPGSRATNSRTAQAEAFKLQYPDGPRDAEGLLVHPRPRDVDRYQGATRPRWRLPRAATRGRSANREGRASRRSRHGACRCEDRPSNGCDGGSRWAAGDRANVRKRSRV